MSATKIIISFCLLLFSSSVLLTAQSSELQDEPTGLPGDGLSLEGALDLFKQASSPEDFEQKLNTENYVNNLDLNQDGKTDFISVNDYMEGEVHAMVLQVNLNAKEQQDVAVIEMEKTGKEEVTLQIIGDEDLYGEQVIVEPTEMVAKSIGKGPNATVEVARIIVNVWAWPSVRYVYRPAYRVYVSPFRWGHYPSAWWTPWKPRTWSACHNYRVKHYRPHFKVVTTHRVVRAHKVYTPYRRTTTVVKTRTVKQVAVNKKTGRKGVVTKSSNKKVVVNNNRATPAKAKVAKGQKTTTTKVGKTANGKVGATRTTTTKKTVKKRGAAQKKGKAVRAKKSVKSKRGN